MEQSINIGNLDKETAFAVAYQAIKNLGWVIEYAGEDKISANTPRKWSSYGRRVMIAINGTSMTVESQVSHGEAFDLGGKNKKNVSLFIEAFDEAAKNLDVEMIEANKEVISRAKEATIKVVGEETEKAAELDTAMHLSGSNLYATYAIMAINLLVFILMVVDGAGLIEPNGYVHLKWGSNYGPLTLSGDYWRLISNTFIHFGIIHLAMNMYCLYTVGVFLEPMLGKAKYIAGYLCTGVLASVASLWWHGNVNSAGASGAVFGLYGLFLALLLANLVPKHIKQSLLQSIAIFIGYNLLYGLKSGVDNSAHIGGLVSGFIVGWIYGYGLKKERQEVRSGWVMPAVIVGSLAITASFITTHKAPTENRQAIYNQIGDSKFKDNLKYETAIKEFYALEEEAMKPLQDTSLTDAELNPKLESESLPAWDKAETILEEMRTYDVSPNAKAKLDKLQEYVSLRKDEIAIYNKIIAKTDQTDHIPELNRVRKKMNSVLAEFQKL